MRYWLELLHGARKSLRVSLAPLVHGDLKRVALYGCREAAELPYLTLREMGIDLVVVADAQSGASFLGYRVTELAQMSTHSYDCLVLGMLHPIEALVEALETRVCRGLAS